MSDEPRTIKLYVLEEESGSRAGFSAVEAITKAVRASLKDVNLAEVRVGLEELVTSVLTVLPDGGAEAKDYEIDEISFTAGIHASGQVSLMSIAGASSSAQVGIQFKLKRRPRQTALEQNNG